LEQELFHQNSRHAAANSRRKQKVFISNAINYSCMYHNEIGKVNLKLRILKCTRTPKVNNSGAHAHFCSTISQNLRQVKKQDCAMIYD
jgi:hypothetical protein